MQQSNYNKKSFALFPNVSFLLDGITNIPTILYNWLINKFTEFGLLLISKVPEGTPLPPALLNSYDYVVTTVAWFDNFIPLTELLGLVKLTIYLTGVIIILMFVLQLMRILRIWK